MSLLRRIEHRWGSSNALAFIEATRDLAAEYELRISAKGTHPQLEGGEPGVRLSEEGLRVRLKQIDPPRQMEIAALDEKGKYLTWPITVRKWYPSRKD